MVQPSGNNLRGMALPALQVLIASLWGVLLLSVAVVGSTLYYAEESGLPLSDTVRLLQELGVA